MERSGATELRLIRHAPALNGGRLCGRTDVDADCSDQRILDTVRRKVGTPNRLVISPAVRIGPALQEIAAARDVTIVAHAGTVRAGLALAVGATAALAFEIAPLSVTRLRALPGGGWSIAEVNWTAP